MSKIFINAGHGGNDKGASKFLVEKDLNLKIAKACLNFLIKNGIGAKMSQGDLDDKTQTSYDVLKEIKNYKPDYAIDIHNNAGGGDGFEVFVGISGLGTTIAKNIEAEVKKIGQNSRGIKTRKNNNGSDYYYFIRETSCPAVICECCFVDHPEDHKILDTDTECVVFGEAIGRGILKTLGIEEKKETIFPEGLYKVQVGAFKERANAEKLAKELKDKGYSTYIVYEE